MHVAVAMLAGIVAGIVAGLVAAFLQLGARRWRNARLLARGGIPYKDCALVPLWWPGAVIGAIAGGLARRWDIAAIAGAAVPGVLLVVLLVVVIAQRFDRAR